MKVSKQSLDSVKIDILLNYFNNQKKDLEKIDDVKIKPFTKEEKEMLRKIKIYKKKMDEEASKNDKLNIIKDYDLVKSIDNYEKKKGKVI